MAGEIISGLFITGFFFAVLFPFGGAYAKFWCCFVATPMYQAVGELNFRENWRWADVLESGRQFHTDSELDREIVHGKTLGGWNLDLGLKFIWTKGPTATGGTISYQYNKEIVLYRTPATLKESATWRWRRGEL